MRESSRMYGAISLAPSAQLMPTVKGFACAMEFQNASVVCPESVRPEASVIVTDTITGKRSPRSRNTSSIANKAALRLSVSKVVSGNRMSTPPSINVSVCSRYTATRSSNVTARKPGSFTSGEIEAVRLVGPIAPAT